MSKTNQPNQPNQPSGTQEKGPAQQKKGHSEGPKNGGIVAMPGMCLSEGCKKKSEKANFCMEHFDWFKEGLITKEGKKPVDFEKKYFHYQRRRQAA